MDERYRLTDTEAHLLLASHGLEIEQSQTSEEMLNLVANILIDAAAAKAARLAREDALREAGEWLREKRWKQYGTSVSVTSAEVHLLAEGQLPASLRSGQKCPACHGTGLTDMNAGEHRPAYLVKCPTCGGSGQKEGKG